MVYSIAETAKANHLKPYEYFEYLLEEIPKHMDDKDLSFCKDLLPWSPNLSENAKKQGRNKTAVWRSKILTRYALSITYI